MIEKDLKPKCVLVAPLIVIETVVYTRNNRLHNWLTRRVHKHRRRFANHLHDNNLLLFATGCYKWCSVER